MKKKIFLFVLVTVIGFTIAFSSVAFGEDKQARRKAFIQKLIDKKILIKTYRNPGALPKAVVGPSFYTLSFDEKQSLISVVYVYWETITGENILVLLDWKTNKRIGTLTRDYGLQLK